MKQLVEQGHDPRALDRLGLSPLAIFFTKATDWIAYREVSNFQRNPDLDKIFELFIDEGADPHFAFKDLTLLHMAVNGNANLSLVQALVEDYGIDVNALSDDGYRAIDFLTHIVFDPHFHDETPEIYDNACPLYHYLLEQGSKPHQINFQNSLLNREECLL